MSGLTNEDVIRFKAIREAEAANLFDIYQEIAGKSAIYPGKGESMGLTYVALKMNGEAGEFAEHVGKAMRDDRFGQERMAKDEETPLPYYEPVPLKLERRELLIKEVGDVLWYLGAACRELGITLSEAAELNLSKLADRTERNTLRGSGDER